MHRNLGPSMIRTVAMKFLGLLHNWLPCIFPSIYRAYQNFFHIMHVIADSVLSRNTCCFCPRLKNGLVHPPLRDVELPNLDTNAYWISNNGRR